MQKWICQTCGWVYDPDGDYPRKLIPPGIAFEALPHNFICPICGASKRFFVPYEPGK